MRTPLRRYLRGHTLATMDDVQAAQSRVYHFDHQGTTQCLTDSAGSVTDRFASDAWGVQVKRSGSSINRSWYIGGKGYSSSFGDRYEQRGVHAVAHQSRFASPLAASAVLTRGAKTGSPYAYAADLPTVNELLGFREQRPGRAHVFYSDYIADFVSFNPAEIFDCCGGARWRISWTLKQRQRPVNPNIPVIGWILQEVEVSGAVTDCDGNPLPFPDGCRYIEAFRYKREALVYDDHFGWNPGDSPKPSKGHWRITGRFGFVEGDTLPAVSGGTWKTGGNPCPNWSTGTLPWTTGEVDAFYLAWGVTNPARRRRSLSFSWRCVCNKCVPDACSWEPHEPKGPCRQLVEC